VPSRTLSPVALGWARMLVVAGIVVAIDQGAKAAVVSELGLGERVDLALGVDVAHVTNRGIAFGLFDDGQGVVVLVTAATLAVVLAWFGTSADRPGLWLGIGLLVGGALGNLADRAREDAVTDFIDPPLWPAFNIADVAITVGVIAIVVNTFAPTADQGRNREGEAGR
jgi:signal peptidase II